MDFLRALYQSYPAAVIIGIAALEWAALILLWWVKMSDDDAEKARKEGEKMGRLETTQENHGMRIGRLEKAVLGLLGLIAAAWGKEKGLW